MSKLTKRTLSLVLAVMMVTTMLTAFVLPGAMADVIGADGNDAYARINATEIDSTGIFKPGKDVFFVDGTWKDTEPANFGEEFDYTYGDGVTWGNGVTYRLVWGENTFTNYADARDYARQLDPDETNNTVFVFAPGSMGATANAGAAGVSNEAAVTCELPGTTVNPTEEQLANVWFLGPQAGVSPAARGVDAVQNGRSSNTEREFTFTSTVWFPTNGTFHYDGFAFTAGVKIYSPFKDYSEEIETGKVGGLDISNLYWGVKKEGSTGNYRWFEAAHGDSGKDSIYIRKFRLTNAFMDCLDNTVEAGAMSFLGSNVTKFDNVVFHNFAFLEGKNMTAYRFNIQPQSIDIVQKDPAVQAYLGGVINDIDLGAVTMINTPINQMMLVRYDRISEEYTSTVKIHDWYLENYGKAGTTATTVYMDGKNLNTSIRYENNYFAFGAGVPTNTMYGAGLLNASKADNIVVKGNTVIADVKGANVCDFYSSDKLCDVSDNVYLDLDGCIRMPRASYVSNGWTSNFKVVSDTHASVDKRGGVKELFTVNRAGDENNNLAVLYSYVQTMTVSADRSDYYKAVVTVLPVEGVSYETANLFKYNSPEVEFQGVYAEETCDNELPTLELGFETAYAKATYTSGGSTCTVIYKIVEPTNYHVVDATGTGSYIFNGTEYNASNAKFYTTVGNAYTGAGKDSFAVSSAPYWIKPLQDVILLTPGTFTGNIHVKDSVAIVGAKFGIDATDGTNVLPADRGTDESKYTGRINVDPSTEYLSVNGVQMGYTNGTSCVCVYRNAKGYYHFMNFASDYFTSKSFIYNYDANKAVLSAAGSTYTDQTSTNANCALGKYNTGLFIDLTDLYYANPESTTRNFVGDTQAIFVNMDRICFDANNVKVNLTYLRLPESTDFATNPITVGARLTNSLIVNEAYSDSTGHVMNTKWLGTKDFSKYVNGVEVTVENCTMIAPEGGNSANVVQLHHSVGNTVDLKLKDNTVIGFNKLYNSYATSFTQEDGATLRSADISGNVFTMAAGTNAETGETYTKKEIFGFSHESTPKSVNFVNVDENLFLDEKGNPTNILVTTGVDKADWYYLDAALSIKNTDMTVVDNGKLGTVTVGAFDGCNNLTIDAEDIIPAADIEACAGAEIEGIFTDEACTVPAASGIDATGVYYVLVGKAGTPITVATRIDATVTLPCEHVWDAGVVTQEPTCSVEGVKTYTCSLCSKTKTEAIATVAHTPVTDPYVAPTCTTKGKTEGSHCSVCNTTLVAQQDIDTVPHTYDAGVVTTEPTCGAKGVKTFTCSVCGGTKTEDVDPTGLHTYDAGVVTTAPTCVAKGVKTFTCTVCGATKTEDVDPTGIHTYDAGVVTTAPTCVDKGVKTFTCSVCGGTKTEDIDPTGIHTYDAGVVTTEPTCGAKGVKTFTCTVCGATRTEEVAATGEHKWDAGVITTEPTCGAKGVKTFTCTVCGATRTEEVAATGEHKWDAGVITTEPTEKAEGVKTFTCTVCGATKTESVPKLAPKKDAAKDFADVRTKDWFYKAVNFAYNEGLFGGTGATTFEPNTNMTRGMFVTVLGRLAGVSSKGAATKFTDVKKSAYYSGYVKWASEKGIVSGTSATKFEPEANVNREQICKMMVEYCKAMGITLVKSKPEIKFADATKISKWARDYVKTCQMAGLVNGKENNKFDPAGNATRAEVATILYNFNNTYGAK